MEEFKQIGNLFFLTYPYIFMIVVKLLQKHMCISGNHDKFVINKISSSFMVNAIDTINDLFVHISHGKYTLAITQLKLKIYHIIPIFNHDLSLWMIFTMIYWPLYLVICKRLLVLVIQWPKFGKLLSLIIPMWALF